MTEKDKVSEVKRGLTLYPLTVEQALEKMLQVKPPTREPRPKSEKDNKDNPL